MGAATTKTCESPYIGRGSAAEVELGPWIGPSPLLGRPTRMRNSPSACDVPATKSSVPLSAQPVKGKLMPSEVSRTSSPDSLLSLASSSQSPS